MGRIVVLGVFVADAAYRSEAMPRAGQTLLGTGFQLGPGGKGSNQAIAAAKAGGEVAFLSRIGADTFGRMGQDAWAAAGVTPWVIEDSDRPTGSAGIFIEEGTGTNAIIIVPGAAGAISEADIETRAADIADATVALTQLEQPMAAAERFLALASAAGVTTILNPAPAAALPSDLLSHCDYVTPNESEASDLTGHHVTGPDDALPAAKALMGQGVRRGVIITLGAQGALFWDGSAGHLIPPLDAGPVIDTSGAGDAFNGGFATGLAAGWPVERALRFASATAALSVTRHGTAASMPMGAEIEALLAGAH